jgi:hypothetical protein
MDKPIITFSECADGSRVWWVGNKYESSEFLTEELKDLLRQLEVHRDLDWKSPF